MQIIVAVANCATGGVTFPTDNPSTSGSIGNLILSQSGAGDWWDCINALGDTAFINSSFIEPNPGDSCAWTYGAILDTAGDPGVDTGFVARLRLKFSSDVVTDGDVFITIQLYAGDIDDFSNAITFWTGETSPVPVGVLAPAVGTTFVEIEIPLTEVQVQNFRAKGGFSDASVIIHCEFSSLNLNIDNFDISYFALEIPDSSSSSLEIIGSGGFIFGGQGLGLDYFVPQGGFKFGGDAELYFDPLEIEGTGGFIFSGSAGLGGNQITGTGGFIFSGGGRDFLILSPDIGGIYFLDFDAHHDTFYLRDGFQGTEDVKIPDPFIQTAYLGD